MAPAEGLTKDFFICNYNQREEGREKERERERGRQTDREMPPC